MRENGLSPSYTLECNILMDIWVSSRISVIYRMCKAFPLGRAFLLSLNIVVVKHHLFISTIPLNPPLKRGTYFCCRYHHICTALTKNRVKEYRENKVYKEFKELREFGKTLISLISLTSLISLIS